MAVGTDQYTLVCLFLLPLERDSVASKTELFGVRIEMVELKGGYALVITTPFTLTTFIFY